MLKINAKLTGLLNDVTFSAKGNTVLKIFCNGNLNVVVCKGDKRNEYSQHIGKTISVDCEISAKEYYAELK